MNKVKGLKYYVIRDIEQYNKYCEILESLLEKNNQSKQTEEEIDLLTALIEKYDDEYTTSSVLDPVQLLHSFMAEHEMNSSDLSKKLNVGKSYISEILNYKKSFSKDLIRGLSKLFKVRQEAFNKEYSLIAQKKIKTRNIKQVSQKSDLKVSPVKSVFKSAEKNREVLAGKKPKHRAIARVKSKG